MKFVSKQLRVIGIVTDTRAKTMNRTDSSIEDVWPTGSYIVQFLGPQDAAYGPPFLMEAPVFEAIFEPEITE